MSRLAAQKGAINLGQGFPEGLEPAALIARLTESAAAGPHQYPSMMGTPSLRRAIARHEKRHWGIELDPDAQVMVTSGATEALAACLLALVEPGDEVVMLEPLYDSYLPIVERGGGIGRLVRLTPPDWSVPLADLAAAFSPRTKALILNSPTNPSGKVYSRAELEAIVLLAIRHDAFVLCDEVYEHLVYDDNRHVPLMSLPGMAERTIKIGSAGKIFSLTGWKVGWVTAAPPVLSVIAKAHQFLTFTTPPALQEAVAWGLDTQAAYYEEMALRLRDRRNRLAGGLEQAGFQVLPAQGSYFLTADYSALEPDRDDEALCFRLIEEAGVAAIPISTFFRGNDPTGYIRFCFAKTDAALDEAIVRLRRWSEANP